MKLEHATEDRKIVAAQQYALKHFTDVEHLNKMRDAWLDGFETAVPKWINVGDELPDSYLQHGVTFESDEVLLDCGDFYVVSRYVRKYDKGVQNLIWEGFDNIEDQEIAERWQKISK